MALIFHGCGFIKKDILLEELTAVFLLNKIINFRINTYLLFAGVQRHNNFGLCEIV